MSKAKLITSMTKTLDGSAKQYKDCNDTELKEIITRDFETQSDVFNTLLQDKHPRIKNFELFTTNIENYISYRELENWE